MKRLYFFLILIFLSAQFGLVENSFGSTKKSKIFSVESPKVLSFKDWRIRRIQEAADAVKRVQKERNSNQKTGARGYTRLEQAHLNLKIAQSLSAHDYFLFYLSDRFKGNKQALEQAAKKLTPADMAEIMAYYQAYRSENNAPPQAPKEDKMIKFGSSSATR